MKITDRYTLKVFLFSLAACLISLVGLYLVVHGFSHVKYLEEAKNTFAAEGLTVWTGLCLYYAVHLPEILTMLGPYALLMAGMYSVHSLHQSNELVPLEAAGVSRTRILLPILLATFVITFGLSVVKEEVVPRLARDMVKASRMLRGKSGDLDRKLGLLRDGSGNIIDAASWDPDRLRLNEVYIWRSHTSRPLHFSFLQWSETPDGGAFRGPAGFEKEGFRLDKDTDLTPWDLETESRSAARLSFRELRRLHLRSPEKRLLAVLMHEHLTYLLTPLVLLLLGLPMVLRNRRQSPFVGLALAFALSLAFFSLSQVMIRLGAQSEALSPTLAAWLPIILFGSAGLLLFESHP
ncbi:MAG TPA: LptF/LptG family permease [Planctomycetes bacterium]|nr:LptF/LptG family permease [Planctomycetota bacterium]